MTKDFFVALRRRHILSILLLGFSSGLPFMWLVSTVQAWYASEGISVKTIGLLSLIAIPYTWKFVWSPFVDRFIIPVLGKRRGWIALMQLCLGSLMLLTAFLNPKESPYLIAFILLFAAFCSATQDIAINAYQTEILRPEERGLGAAQYTFGYRIAVLVSSGIAMCLADYLGWRVVIILLSLLFFLSIISTCYAPEPTNYLPPKNLRLAFVLPFKELLTRKHVFAILLFIILYKLGDNFTQALLSTFLIKGLGFSLSQVGTTLKTVGFFATILGVYIGGYSIMRIGLFRSLLIFAFFQMLSSLCFLWLDEVGKHLGVLMIASASEEFSAGMGTAALLAYLMFLCNQHYTATQFAIFSSLDSIGRTYSGPFAAWIENAHGWSGLFVFSMFMAIPGIIVLLYLGVVGGFKEIKLKQSEQTNGSP